VAFDKPLDSSITKQMVGRAIEFGEYVRAADRFEKLKPPYKVVSQQEATPRGKLKIVGARMANEHTLVLATDPHPQSVGYALTIPGVKAPGVAGDGAMVDVDYEVDGALRQAQWSTLVRGLPYGRELARGISEGFLSLGDSVLAGYPFIHRNESDEKTVELAGGDFERGRSLFFGEQLKCATCHRIRGEGGVLGPDLSNLVSRDAASVLRDIKEPNASINPDYVAYNVRLRDGGDLTGFVRSQDDHSLRLAGADGKESVFTRDEVTSLRPSTVSLMPSGLIEPFKEEQVRDLLTFVLSAPPSRTRAEYEKAIAVTPSTLAVKAFELKIVLVASKQDHGPGQHDYPAWQTNWHQLLAQSTNAIVQDAWLWPSAEQFSQADVLVFYYWNRDWNAEKFRQLDEFLARGGGMVILHSATIGNPAVDDLAERIGLAADSGKTKYLHTPVELNIVAPANDPITRGLPAKLQFLDEPYWPMIGDTNKVQILATAQEEGQARPMMWTFEKGKGRVFASIFGHYTWTWNDPLFRLIVLRAIEWTAGRGTTALDSIAAKDTNLNQ